MVIFCVHQVACCLTMLYLKRRNKFQLIMKEQMMVIFYVHQMAWCSTKVVPEEKKQIPLNHERTDDGNILCSPDGLVFDKGCT